MLTPNYLITIVHSRFIIKNPITVWIREIKGDMY